MTYEPLICVENLTKIYRIGTVDFPALDGVNLEIDSGEFISIVGPSGSGKSTLLNMLGALDRPTSGHVYIEGWDLFKRNENQLAEFRNTKLGFIFQAHNLLMRTPVLANVALPGMIAGDGKADRMERARDLLESVGLGDKVTRKPTELSGGEQQRVAVARALMNDPLIVLGDEPTGNLDSKTGAEIVALLKQINSERGTLFILVTHNPEVAGETDRVIHLRDGRVSEEPYGELAEEGAPEGEFAKQAEAYGGLAQERESEAELADTLAEVIRRRRLERDFRDEIVAASTIVMPAAPTKPPPSARAAKPARFPASTTTVSPVASKFCRQCGVKIPRESKYCEECGKKLV
jgi:putative ABC transport system ATP-binding protein